MSESATKSGESAETEQEADSAAGDEKTTNPPPQSRDRRIRPIRDDLAAPIDRVDIFADVYGHEGAKLLLRNALRSGETHVLMIGPPGSGKSLLLQSLEQNLPGVEYWDSKALKPSKLQEILSLDPPILLLDEFHRMSPECYDVLTTPMETGRIQKGSANESYDRKIDTQIIASCNPTDRIPARLESRFGEPIVFEEYSEKEYYEVCERMLVKDIEWIETPTQAREVAEVARQFSETTDPRSARNIARLADSFDEVDKVAKALHDPDAEVGGVSLSPIEIAQTREQVERERLTQIAVADASEALAARFPTHESEADPETASDVKREIEEAVESEIEAEMAAEMGG